MPNTAHRQGLAAALMTLCLVATPALADVSGYLGNWVNPQGESGGFLSSLVGSGPSDTSGIASVVVTPAGASHVRIHLYGRCQPVACDWGTQQGRNHSAAPDSDDVQSISADFNTGSAQKRLVLRLGPGGSLRFEVTTDFTDGSAHHDFETNGRLTVAPAQPAAIASTATPAAPPPPGTPVAAAITGTSAVEPSGAPSEDCVAINPADVFVAPVNRGWNLADYDHTILKFGSNKLAALKAQIVLDYYHIDEQCFIARPHPQMIYWRSAGQVPHLPMPGQDCNDVHPANIRVTQSNGSWIVAEGATTLLDYSDDQAAARLAESAIRSYRLTKQCFVANPDRTMTYWLAQ